MLHQRQAGVHDMSSHDYYIWEAAWMPTGRNADHLLGPNADRAEWRRAECRPQLHVLGRNADSKLN